MLPKEQNIILASGSEIRRQLLVKAGLTIGIVKPNVDEVALRENLQKTGAGSEEIALTLARTKAQAVSSDHINSIVIGADQVLVCNGTIFAKAKDRNHAKQQLEILAGETHRLISAVAVYGNGQISWEHVGFADMTMRSVSDDEIDEYLDRNWPQVQYCVGCYMLENEGSWLFSKISGDYFTVLGLPLLDLLGYLSGEGVRPT